MAERKLSEVDREFIRHSSPKEHPTAELSRRFGVSEQRIRELRREGRRERHEAARSVIAQHVEDNIPDALADLTVLRVKARAAYESSTDSRDGQLWLAAIKTTLEYVTPDDAELDRAIAAELEALASERQEAGTSEGAAVAFPPVN